MTRNHNQFNLTYSLTEPQFIAACHSLWAHRAIGPRGNLLVAMALSALGAFLIWQAVPGWWGWALIIGSAIIIAMNTARDRIWRRAYRQSPKYKGDIHAQFSEDGVAVQSGEGQSEVTWSHFQFFLRTPAAVFLIVDQRQFSVIPTSAFSDKVHADRFEALLAAHLKRLPRRYL